MKKYKIEITIFLAAFLISMIFLALLLIFNADEITAGKGDYIQTAKNLVDFGVFSSLSGDPPAPDNWRTPVYILFLSFFLWLKIPLFAISVIQDIIFAASAVMVYSLGKRIFTERTAKISALIFAVEPFGAFVSNMHQSEAIFLPFFIPAVFFILFYIKDYRPKYLYWFAVLTGISILIRPILFYILFFEFFLVFIIAFFEKQKRIVILLKEMIFAFLLVILIISPWFIRNKIHFGSFNNSSVSGSALYDYALMFGDWLGDEEGVEEMQNQIAESLKVFPLKWYLINPTVFERNNNDLVVSLRDGGILKFSRGDIAAEVGKAGKIFIFKHPFKYMAYNFIFLPHLFYEDSYNDFVRLFVSLGGDRHFRGLSYYIVNLKFKEIPGQIKNNALLISVGIVPKLFFALASFLAFCNLFLLKKYWRGDKYAAKIIFFLAALLFLYAVLVSPAGIARYRFPFNPFIFLLALNFIFFTLKKSREDKYLSR